MDEALWQRMEPLLDDLLDLSGSERAGYLDQHCDDPTLRAEIESFVADCLAVDGFLDEDTLDLAKERALDRSFDESLVDRRFGAYRTLEILGKGGMGTVLLAERADGHFEQQVAIKVVNPRRLGEQSLERFRFERQILADLEHPFIAKLLDGGVSDDGMPFLVMDQVDGLPLDQYVERSTLSVRRRLELLIDICAAIEHAHRRRVVHLDLKPSNILITPDGRPSVLDFGIAQMLDQTAAGSGSSSSGRMTPHYAAPEQLRGESVTSFCDVYSLGVILFRLLTGHLPFERRQEDVEAFVRRISQEPAPRPSSRTDLPSAKELDAVTAKALHKDPTERYGSALELAQDLQRILDSRPIKALPNSRAYVWKKHVQRHHRAWLAGTLFTVVIVGLGLAWWSDRQAAQQRLSIAQDFAREAEGIEGFLRYAYALPAHDVRREKALSLERMSKIREQMRTLGSVADGPGYLALGRAQLMLRRPREARRNLQQAWDSGLQSSEAAFALGKALGDIYSQERTAALEIRDPALRALEAERLSLEYRDPALKFLGRVHGVSEVTSPSIVAAMIALLEEKPERALELSKQAMDEAPWLPDGLRLQGEAWNQIARSHIGDSLWQEAEDAAAQAIASLEGAARLAPSDTLIADLLCDAHLTQTAPARFRRASQDQTRGVEACKRAAELDPDLGHSRLQLARFHIYGMQDPSASLDDRLAGLQRGLELADAVLASLPGDPEALSLLGSAYLTRAVFLSRAKGEDPREDLETAAAHLADAVSASPGLIVGHVNRGTAMAILAEERLARGGDPDPAFRDAIESFQEALDRSPDHGAILTNLGNLLFNRAVYLQQQGRDVSSILAEALAVCDRSLRVNTGLIQAFNLRAAAYEALARIAVIKGEAWTEPFEQSKAALDRAREINSDYPLPWVNEGALFLTQAFAALRSGDDPMPAIRASLAALDHAASLSAAHHDVLDSNLAETRLLAARWIWSRGNRQDRAELDAVERVIRSGLEASPRSSLLRLRGAHWALFMARIADSDRRMAYLDQSQGFVDRLLQDRPSFAEGHLLAAEIELWKIALGAEVEPRARQARSHLEAVRSADGLESSPVDFLNALVSMIEGSGTMSVPEIADALRRAELEDLSARLKRARDARAPGP